MKSALFFLLIIFSCFPYISILQIHTDSQPNALICGVLIFFFYIGKIRGKTPQTLMFLCIIAFILLLFSGLSFNALRSFANYLSLFFITIASYHVIRRMSGFKIEVYKAVVMIWFFVGTVQVFIAPDFLSFLLPRGDSVATTQTGRGVVCLAPEPTHYGLICILLFLLGFINWRFDKNVRFCYLLLFTQVFVYARSSLAILIVILTAVTVGLYMAFTDKRNRVKTVLIMTTVSMIFVSGIYIGYQELQSFRVGVLLKNLIDDPLSIVTLDASVNERFIHIIVSIKGFLDNFMLPHGFDNFAPYYKEFLKQYWNYINDYTFNQESVTRIQSGWGAALYEMGIFVILIINVIFSTIASVLKGADKILVSVILFLVFFNAFPLSTPIVSLIIGNLLYLKELK